MRIEQNTLSPQIFKELFTSVGWSAPGLEQIETALAGSIVCLVAYDGEIPVGMVRLIGDTGMSYYIKDFAIRPEDQGKGVGRMLMQHLEDYIYNQLKPGWAVSLELISSKGKESFYRKFGFEDRPCDWDGAGMFKMLRK